MNSGSARQSAWAASKASPFLADINIAAVYPKLYETRTEPELHYIALDE